jgi:hypothetical protein
MDLAIAHPELFHYTTSGGMEGILRTQTLWATQAMFLNDTSELRAFAELLPDLLRAAVDEGIEPLLRFNPNQQILNRFGGKAALVEQVVRETTNAMYGALLGTPTSPAYIEPYVVSFCTASNTRVAEHGLLSQWRGYGRDGGYVLVFDTARFDALVGEEAGKWTWAILMGGDVVYSSYTLDRIREEIGDSMDAMKKSVGEFLRTAGNPDILEPLFFALTQCACRYNQWGFAEENEVRIVAIPANKQILEEARRHNLPVSEIPRHAYLRHGTTVPCIRLFEGDGSYAHKPLPIKRVIVGPHPEKERRQRAVEILLRQLGIDIPVSISEIPYAPLYG